jgi:hypothetical protein
MKLLFQFPIATIYLARLFLVFVRTPVRLLLCSLTLCGITFLTSAPARAQPVKFASTSISQISVTSGGFATFSGVGTLNGQAEYMFMVSATDGGGAGSGLDTILVQISGPNNFTLNAPATIAGGDLVVHP